MSKSYAEVVSSSELASAASSELASEVPLSTASAERNNVKERFAEQISKLYKEYVENQRE